MKTDDFLADLETQLRDVADPDDRRAKGAASEGGPRGRAVGGDASGRGGTPRGRAGRRHRWAGPAAALAAVAAVAVLIVVAAGDGTDREEAVPAAGGTSVLLENATGTAAVGPQVERVLEKAGYDVTLRERPGVPDSAILGAEPTDARRIADLLHLPDAATGRADRLTVILGKNQLGAGLEPLAVVEASGRPLLEFGLRERLQAAGLMLGSIGSHGSDGDQATTRVVGRDPSDDALIATTREALGLPPAVPKYATASEREEMSGARVLAVIGRDYTLAKVLVRNATGEPDGIDEAMDVLVRAGYDVSTTTPLGAARRTQIDYTAGNQGTALRVADRLNLESTRFVAVSGDTGDLDVIVTLGAS